MKLKRDILFYGIIFFVIHLFIGIPSEAVNSSPSIFWKYNDIKTLNIENTKDRNILNCHTSVDGKDTFEWPVN